MKAFLDAFPSKLNEYEGLLTKNQIWLKRTRGVGIIPKNDAVAYGLVGPMARASGLRTVPAFPVKPSPKPPVKQWCSAPRGAETGPSAAPAGCGRRRARDPSSDG